MCEWPVISKSSVQLQLQCIVNISICITEFFSTFLSVRGALTCISLSLFRYWVTYLNSEYLIRYLEHSGIMINFTSLMWKTYWITLVFVFINQPYTITSMAAVSLFHIKMLLLCFIGAQKVIKYIYSDTALKEHNNGITIVCCTFYSNYLRFYHTYSVATDQQNKYHLHLNHLQ